MITQMVNLTATNVGGVKKAIVTATEGGLGSVEQFNFTVIDQNLTTTESFNAGEQKAISVVHTASGKGLVIVTNAASGLTLHCWLDVDSASNGC